MGVNNRQRRAAKRRKRSAARGTRLEGSRPPHGWYEQQPAGYDERAVTTALVLAALAEIEADPATATRYATLFTGPRSPVAPRLVAETVSELLADTLAAIRHHGWTPSDLAEIVRRRLTPRHLPMLAALLEAGRSIDLRAPADLELALDLWSVIDVLPAVTQLLPPPGAPLGLADHVGGPDGRLLSKVRSLLAKAESTQYAEEAEALSAKAQELISRYALGRLIAPAQQNTGKDTVTARRMWVDAPYVLAKAMLIDAVAGANRCRTVLSERLGFSTVVGEVSDVEAVELLATSLLVQANTAMLRFGQQADRRGTSRTRSFRRSFLVAYASRIGDRLRTATQDAAAETGRVAELVPALRRQAQQVDEACGRMFPEVIARGVRISNGLGWAEGRAAADLALLDTRLQVTEAAS